MLFPWHIFLLPLFYVLHAYNDYFGIIDIKVPLLFLGYYLLLSLSVFTVSYLLLRNISKAGFLTIQLLIYFFFFGAAHDFLKRLPLPSWLASYSFLLSISFILFIYIIIRLRKAGAPIRGNRFFLYLFSLLFIMEMGISLFYLFTNGIKKKDPAGNNTAIRPILHGSEKPDIFFMVFDEYASSLALNKYYQFNNSRLDTTLKNSGFYVATHSQSNYNATFLSIASTLNMQYFNTALENTTYNSYTWIQGAYAYRNCLLPAFLRENGYQVINYGLWDVKDHPINVEPFLKNYPHITMYHATLWGRISRDILWNLIVRLPWYRKEQAADMKYITRNKTNYTNFLHELSKETDNPRFVIGHVMMPHMPAYLNRHGQPRIMSEKDRAAKMKDSIYLDQLLYVNTWIDTMAKTVATSARRRPLVLIIEGDHGRRGKDNEKMREKQFMNLNTYYFADKDYSMLYDSISPVNSFRVVLNKYFQAGLPLLKDSTIRLSD